MAFQAGSLNVGGYMSCHRFVSHVTGFGTLFGYEVYHIGLTEALSTLAVPLFFLLGCMISGFLVDVRLKLHKKPKYYISFGLIFFLITLTWLLGINHIFGEFGEAYDMTRSYFLLVLLCLSCGIQNATVTSVSNSVVRTTHLTGPTTDLGIGLARVMSGERLQGKIDIRNEIKANFMRAGIIMFFIVGAVSGGYLYKNFAYQAFFMPVLTSGLLFFTMIFFQFFRRPAVRT